ncbi:MAG TPA: 16S rRNA (uracil(1498)-N(3))-methyltransferase [Pyrinomonadaceae bacterium]
MRRFFAAPGQFTEHVVTLSQEETRHLRDVLRLKTGDEVQVFDGEGREFLCEIMEIRREGTSLRVIRETEPVAAESPLDLRLAVSFYKSDKLDLVIQKAVELGVSRLSLLVTARSEIKFHDAGKRTERFQKIAMEATKQCERAKVMQVDEPSTFENFMSDIDGSAGLLLMFSEKGGGSIPSPGENKKITALIGPKGGWDDTEIESAVGRGFVPVKLGRRIMRAETAAITFAALLQHRFGDLN